MKPEDSIEVFDVGYKVQPPEIDNLIHQPGSRAWRKAPTRYVPVVWTPVFGTGFGHFVLRYYDGLKHLIRSQTRDLAT
jgi:hypothetical protein